MRTLKEIQRDTVIERLSHFQINGKPDKKAAAKSLGVSLKTLYNYIVKFKLQPQGEEQVSS